MWCRLQLLKAGFLLFKSAFFFWQKAVCKVEIGSNKYLFALLLLREMDKRFQSSLGRLPLVASTALVLVLVCGNAAAFDVLMFEGEPCVDTAGLLGFIGLWEQGSLSMPALFGKIALWKSGEDC